jgi:HK97 gp10 family phage protein
MEGRGKVAGIALKSAIETALVKFGIVLEGTASLLAPYDKGRLRASITYATRDTPAKPGPEADASDSVQQPTDSLVLHVGTSVEYAIHQEYGTKKMKAQPFMRPALDLRRGLFPEILRDEFKKALSKVGKQ